ncbi:hypothetical protein FHR24_000626 [Wenyingzhuangia heitensis]|uniref:Sce7725 family protein n=1 Tax=Wenyingzhuangia heitensis TaxID=1487859 RepID=A0ABX0U5W5_9FLAO|nr:sce7725 family protein [Wenyingzhuangia heitensis]NIJ44187.1 hypothetical protein [Wenyingzhuangia heitensis]
MYFPYLRGKQFELIALRELAPLMSINSNKISPIIEPVKDSSTLKSTLKKLIKSQVNFNYIINPRVGSLQNSPDTPERILNILKEQLDGYSNFQLAVIVDKHTEHNLLVMLDFLNNLNLDYKGITFIHTSQIQESSLEYLNKQVNIKYNVIYFEKTSRRYYREFNNVTRVSLDDYFEKLDRNSDYLNTIDDDFSEEFKYYKTDGFIGFSDFLTIGDVYSESGFLPRAVVIHLTYRENDKIKIRHFTSESNQDSSDIGGKFAEALEKLVTWCEQTNITETQGIKIFKDLYKDGHFPGLGSIKKISTINHIELIIKNI